MARTILLDGDINAYQVAASIETPIDWGDGLWTLHSDENEGIQKLDDQIALLRSELEADRVVIALSDGTNFRYDILPSYKSNRKDTRKPVCLPQMRQYLRDTYEVFERPGLEGDDVLGIISTSKKIIPGDKIVVSIDKDLRTIPGQVLNLNKAYKAIEEVGGTLLDHVDTITEGQADLYHMVQTLTGDTTDGYKGCPGIGPKKAAQVLELPLDQEIEDLELSYADGWPRIVAAYEKAKLSEEAALQQARVARILRRQDYDFRERRPRMWSPPG